MKYQIWMSSRVAYEAPAAHGRHVLRLTPREASGQRIFERRVTIEPNPTETAESVDFFGNPILTVIIDQPHPAFDVRLDLAVEVDAPAHVDPLATPAWEEVAAAALTQASLSPDSPAHFLGSSRMAKVDPEITAYARQSFPPGRPVLAGAVDLMSRMRVDFIYETGATDVTTMPHEAFAARRGVCQDFAHVMISGLRGLGLAASYVSGFLRTSPPEGEARLIGADAMHAWVSLWCGPQLGWAGLDPTNALIENDDHIVIAVGRDYADVAPDIGVVVTHGRQTVSVAVDVEPQG